MTAHQVSFLDKVNNLLTLIESRSRAQGNTEIKDLAWEAMNHMGKVQKIENILNEKDKD